MICIFRQSAHAALVVTVASCLGCGGDSPSNPAGPSGPPTQSASPSLPPNVRSVVITTLPFDPVGYAVGETIGIQITFSEAVTVSGSPRLALEIGDDTRHAAWDEDTSAGAFVVFRYEVTLEDRDEDGISIGADALDLGGGAIENAGGVEADVGIGEHAITDDDRHLVLGAPPERECGEERSLARRFSASVVSEWDGTPFRVDMVRNFPEFVTDADLQQLLDPIGRLAHQIETQLGYRIVEMGDLIEVPSGAPAGWDQDFERYWRNDLLPREPGQILVFYLNDDNPEYWDGRGGSTMNAHLCCGTISYNKRSLGPLWTGEDPCCEGNTIQREGIVHELFHLLGFKHVVDHEHLVGIKMSRGALDLPWETGSPTYYATWTDVDNLRCIFPEGG